MCFFFFDPHDVWCPADWAFNINPRQLRGRPLAAHGSTREMMFAVNEGNVISITGSAAGGCLLFKALGC